MRNQSSPAAPIEDVLRGSGVGRRAEYSAGQHRAAQGSTFARAADAEQSAQEDGAERVALAGHTARGAVEWRDGRRVERPPGARGRRVQREKQKRGDRSPEAHRRAVRSESTRKRMSRRLSLRRNGGERSAGRHRGEIQVAAPEAETRGPNTSQEVSSDRLMRCPQEMRIDTRLECLRRSVCAVLCCAVQPALRRGNQKRGTRVEMLNLQYSRQLIREC